MSNFYAVPIHYQGARGIYSVLGGVRTIAPAVNDNDYRTFSSDNTFIVQTFGASATTNTRIDAVFIKARGIAQYSVTVPTGMGTGMGETDHVLPSTVMTAERQSIPTTINDFQHELLDLRRNAELGLADRTLEAREVEFQFTGTNIRIYEIMCLRHLLTLDANRSYTSVDHNQMHNILRKRNIRGGAFSIQSLSSRAKWESRYTARFNEFSPTTYEAFTGFVQSNQNFVFAPEYTRYPDRVYPATWGSENFGNSYVSRRYTSGIQVSYSIMEA